MNPDNVKEYEREQAQRWAVQKVDAVTMDPEEFHIYTRVYNWGNDYGQNV